MYYVSRFDNCESMPMRSIRSTSSSSSSTTAATGASYNTISFIVADIVCPSSSDSDNGTCTPKGFGVGWSIYAPTHVTDESRFGGYDVTAPTPIATCGTGCSLFIDC